MSLKREHVGSDGSGRETKKTKTNDIRSLRGMDIEKVVGSGTFGVVFKATIKDTGERVALKKFKLEIDPQGQGFPMQALREIRILKALKLMNHVNIVKLFTMVTYVPEDDDEKEGDSRQTTHGFTPGDVFMVFEYVDYDLSGLLKCRDVHLTEAHIQSYTKQLLEGVHFLHHNKILHRDIKGPNILVTRDNVIKIADLGLARSYRNLDQKFTNSNSVVTLWYRSPELLLGTKSYGPEVDIWSVGCLFGEMNVRDAILKGTTEAEQLELIYKLFGTPTGELEDDFSKFPEYASEKMKFATVYPNRVKRDSRFSKFSELSLALFNKLLDINPKTRITSRKAVDDDYFWSSDPLPKPEDLPRFNVEVATDMSETERMKAERAARIALEEERIKAEKEGVTGGGPGNGPGIAAGRGRLGGRGAPGRGRQLLGNSKYTVSKPVIGGRGVMGPGSGPGPVSGITSTTIGNHANSAVGGGVGVGVSRVSLVASAASSSSSGTLSSSQHLMSMSSNGTKAGSETNYSNRTVAISATASTFNSKAWEMDSNSNSNDKSRSSSNSSSNSYSNQITKSNIALSTAVAPLNSQLKGTGDTTTHYDKDKDKDKDRVKEKEKEKVGGKWVQEDSK